MMGASMPREPGARARAMDWRSSLAHDRKFWALVGRESRRESRLDVRQKWLGNWHIFRSKTSLFATFFELRPSPWSRGLLWRVSLNPGHVGVEDWHKISSNPRTRVWHFDLFSVFCLTQLGKNTLLGPLISIYTQPIIYFWLFIAPFAFLCSKFPKFKCFVALLFLILSSWDFNTFVFMGWFLY